MQIDHDPEEPPRDRTGTWPLWLGAFMIAVFWVGNLLYMPMDWNSVCLGAITGGVFVIIMNEVTGNKVPKWMRPR